MPTYNCAGYKEGQMNHQWSPWYRLDDEVAKTNVPDKPGIYEIGANFEFGRLNGKSRIISIGRAAPSLRTRLCKERFSDMARYLNRPEKWLVNAGHTLEFHYIITSSGEEALWLEALRHWEYENQHWELPPGNDRLEKAAIMKRIERKYAAFNDKILQDLLEQHQTT